MLRTCFKSRSLSFRAGTSSNLNLIMINKFKRNQYRTVENFYSACIHSGGKGTDVLHRQRLEVLSKRLTSHPVSLSVMNNYESGSKHLSGQPHFESSS
jgi:hypothetical protein